VSALSPGARSIWPAGITEMRRGAVGLATLVQQSPARNTFYGALYAFRGRRAGLIKLIWHDGTGLCMLTKRIEQGRFRRGPPPRPAGSHCPPHS
jgi:transposase